MYIEFYRANLIKKLIYINSTPKKMGFKQLLITFRLKLPHFFQPLNKNIKFVL